MNKSSHLVKIFILYFLTQFSYLHSAIQENIVAKVENQIISSYELKNKIKTILFLSNQQLNQNNINLTKNEAMRALINFKSKKDAAASLVKSSSVGPSPPVTKTYLDLVFARLSAETISSTESPMHC